MRAPDRIASLVLAAGAATRFGGIKQIAWLRGRPLIEHAIAAARSTPTESTIVVLGCDAETVADVADLSGTTIVLCGDWAEGPGASLRAGLRVVSEAGFAAAVLTLGDEPFVNPIATSRLIGARAPGRPALRAVYGERVGHPVLIERELFPAFTAPGRLPRPRAILDAAGVEKVDCTDLGDPEDIDTREQLRAISLPHQRTTRPTEH